MYFRRSRFRSREPTVATFPGRLAARQRLAQAQARSDAAFRTLVEAAPCVIVILRPDRRILYVNQFAEDLTGHHAGAVLGQDYAAIFLTPDYRPAVAEKLTGVLAGTPARGFENPVLCKDSSQRWLICLQFGHRPSPVRAWSVE